MEKLIIKNFGPISNAEIDIKKYTLLIGDTSTGKSVIAKLICIFRDFQLKGINNIDDFREELERYAIPYLNEETTIEYFFRNNIITIQSNILQSKGGDIQFINFLRSKNLSKETVDAHYKIQEYIDKGESMNEKILDLQKKIEEVFDVLKKKEPLFTNFLLNSSLSLYIPAERMFFSMLGNSIAGLWANNINISKSFIDFAAHYEKAKSKISEFEYPPLNFTYHNEKSEEYILFNGKKINIKYTSSGIQAILPLIIVLQNLPKDELDMIPSIKTICIEEPEISLFPNRQKELLEYIIPIIKGIDSDIVMTTHSPYILSAFNNLILANNTAEEKPDREKKIEEIISKDKWVKYEEVSAYEVKDGTIVSLMDEEYKSFDVNAIDRVSDRLSEQLDGLLDIRYEE